MRIFHLNQDSFTPEPAYNTIARRFFPWEGLNPSEWGGGWVGVLPGETTSAHNHDEREVFFIVKGTGVLRHGDEVHRVGYGTSICIEPGVDHSLTNDGDEDLVFISVWWDSVELGVKPEELT